MLKVPAPVVTRPWHVGLAKFALPNPPLLCDNFAMDTIRLVLLRATLFFSLSIASMAIGQTTTKKELNVSFAPLEVIKPILEKALTKQGKFLMLANKGAVLVIDTPEGILAAEAAIAGAQLPPADIALDFQFVTGLPERRTTITMAQEVPFPVEFAPPTIFVGGGRVTGVVPATPTKFQTRNIGVTSESVSTRNPDGSITLDINTESTALDGFINYGSAILPAGAIGAVPVNGLVGDPGFFTPFINTGGISLPIISTTRISTSIVIRPRLEAGVVNLDMMPRLQVVLEGSQMEPQLVDLKQFHTTVAVPNNEVARVYGFTGADDAFNRRFFAAKDPESGGTAVVVKAKATPPKPASSVPVSPVAPR